ncbi:MAG TPA: hypothetical protein VK868_10920 [Pyrinomonadaceae bacterium]|nr:hypothetical protein [Pyrinomonadaceae bacterium]
MRPRLYASARSAGSAHLGKATSDINDVFLTGYLINNASQSFINFFGPDVADQRAEPGSKPGLLELNRVYQQAKPAKRRQQAWRAFLH